MHSIKLYSNRYLTQALLLFDPFCLSSFSHFAQNRTTIPTRKEIRARFYLEPIGNKYRIRSRRGTSCTCCRQGAWGRLSWGPRGSSAKSRWGSWMQRPRKLLDSREMCMVKMKPVSCKVQLFISIRDYI